jgi:hypothetical protein
MIFMEYLLLEGQVEEDEIVGICSTRVDDEMCVQQIRSGGMVKERRAPHGRRTCIWKDNTKIYLK